MNKPVTKHEPRNETRTQPRTQKEYVALLLDASMLARVDALLPLYTLPGREPTRSDALRALLLAGCDAEERRAASRGPQGGGEAGKP